MNSPEKVIQSGVIDMELSDNELIDSTRKTWLLKLNERYEISIRSKKNYSDESFAEELGSIKFPTTQIIPVCLRFSSGLCYEVFISNRFVVPIRILRAKSNTKPWFDIDILMLFKTMTSAIKSTNYQARKLTKKILN